MQFLICGPGKAETSVVPCVCKKRGLGWSVIVTIPAAYWIFLSIHFFLSIFKVFWVPFQIYASVLCHLQLEARDTGGCFKDVVWQV